MEVPNPPTDGITRVRYRSNQLLVSSWDAQLRLYNTQTLAAPTIAHEKAAILDCSFLHTPEKAISGGLSRSVVLHDLLSEKQQVLGTHEAPVRCLEVATSQDMIISGGWDHHVKLWDAKSPGTMIHQLNVSGKVYTMSTAQHLLLIGTSGREISIFDIRKYEQPLLSRESPLKYQTRCAQLFPEANGYVLGSIEGRIAVEKLHMEESMKSKGYAFKCHRQKVDEQTFVFPVNCIAFHPGYGTFASGGCDGVINMWDAVNKKRITQLGKYETSIASMDFNEDGTQLAIAVSYTFEEGEKDHPRDSLHIRNIQDHEVKPKSKA